MAVGPYWVKDLLSLVLRQSLQIEAPMSDLSQFTEEIRGFFSDKLTPELRHFGEAYPGYHCPLPVAKEWTRILDDVGWSVPAWPVEHGGTGWSTEQLVIFKREMMLAHAPRLMKQGRGAASALASVSKVHGTALQQRVTEFAVEVMGNYAIPKQPRLLEDGCLDKLIGVPSANTAISVSQYFGDRCLTIAGGTTEIQKNIIATRVLGL